MDNKSKKIKRCINPDIKVGDIVRVWDGSGLSCDKSEEQIYIILPYFNLTGSSEALKYLDFTVTKTNQSDHIVLGVLDNCYLQDVAIEYNGVEFRCCSSFLTKQP